MAKVEMPLGSSSAHGAVGDMIVYQGDVAREYVIPFDPKTEAQLDVRKLFYDVTGVIKRLGLLGRGLLAGIIGPRWYTSSYKRVAENGAARLLENLGYYSGFSSENKTAWSDASPFQDTYNDRGQIFFGVVSVLDDWIDSIIADHLFSIGPLAGNAWAYRAEWLSGVQNVVTLAKADDLDTRLNYVGTWDTVSAGSAYLGSYSKTSEPNARIEFLWKGKKLKIGFVGLENGGVLQVDYGALFNIEIDQHRSSTTYGLSQILTAPNKGIHKTSLQFFGSPTQVVTLDYLDGSN